MKHGQVVFFKAAKMSTGRTAPEIGFKGYAFGILLGVVPPFQKDPPMAHILRALGGVGFLSFDDVGELLGPEQGALLVKKYEEKYYGQQLPDAIETGGEADTVKDIS